MTVGELLDLLANVDPDTPVTMTLDDGTVDDIGVIVGATLLFENGVMPSVVISRREAALRYNAAQN